jgi:ribonuclease HI
MTVYAFIDGASRNNPGDAGIGIILKDSHGATLKKEFGCIGKATNNIAEYQALLACLKIVQTIPCSKLIVHSDSELLVRQMNGEYRVKEPKLKRCVAQAHTLIQSAPFEVEVIHIVREQNREADRLANLGIDTKRRMKV